MQRQRIRHAVRAIQSHPSFRNVPIVSIPENAPGNAGPQIHEYLLDYENVMTMAEWNARGDLGVPATDRNQQTERMALMLAHGSIYYSKNLATYPRDLGGQALDALQDKFERQLLCWERVMRYDPSDPLSKVSFKWTAKTQAGNDDLAVVGLMLAFWPDVIYTKPRYLQFVQNYIQPRRQLTANLPPVDPPTADAQRKKRDLEDRPTPALSRKVARPTLEAKKVRKLMHTDSFEAAAVLAEQQQQKKRKTATAASTENGM